MNGWQQAIECAEVQLKDAEGRARELRAAIRTYRKCLRAGAPFPGRRQRARFGKALSLYFPTALHGRREG